MKKKLSCRFFKKIYVASKIKNFPIKVKKHRDEVIGSTQPLTPRDTNIKNIIAIGTSTGGPRALQEILPYIPKSLPASYIIVQHMPPGFTKSLAERLNNLSDIMVKEAVDRDILHPGVAYIAPGDYHILIEKIPGKNMYWIRLSSSPSVSGHRPSVNVMFNSISETNLNNVVGVIMTGMGNDGCEGMKNLKLKNKAYIIAQDEKSCVVYGMPKAVIEAGVADVVVPLEQIAKEIIKVVEVR